MTRVGADDAGGMPPLTVSVAFVDGMLSGLVAKGFDCDDLLSEVGIAPERLRDPEARVTLQQYAALLERVMERHDDEGLGLLSRRLKRGCFALQVRSLAGAATLDVAVRRVAHIFRLLQDDVILVPFVEGAEAGVALEFVDPRVAGNRYVHELFLRVYWRLFAFLLGGQLPVLRFDFAFPRPAYSEGYAPIFPAPWRFDAQRSAMWFGAELLRFRVRRDEQALREFVAEGTAKVILPARDDGTGGRVRLFMQRARPQWPDLEATARALHLSASSLQRRLAAEGTTFQVLKDRLRRDVAIHRLSTSDVPMAKLAAELGFADSAAFQRAFKNWTGCPPGSYRSGGRRSPAAGD